MKKIVLFLAGAIVFITIASHAQMKRSDAVWARTVPAGSITIDGKMNEPVWNQAESLVVEYGKSAGLPGSGWTAETGVVLDSVKAVVKFLVMGDSLYLGFTVKDSSIGGGIFGAADGIIFNIRDKSDNQRHPASSGEYLWGWINEGWMDAGNVTSPGAMPKIGPKDAYTKTLFETATTVKGTTNVDGTNDNKIVDPTKIDTSYTVEMKIALKNRGYNVTSPKGDIIMFNAAIRDCDWAWPFQDFVTFSRVWIQGPWANTNDKNFLRIYVRPDVTNISGAVPSLAPDYVISNGESVSTPAIDGTLDELVWSKIEGIKIRYGDDAVRNSYAGVGPFASGQYQPNVNGSQAFIYDTSDVTVKMFFKGNTLYFGIDVNDKVVQFYDLEDRWDGMVLSINGLGKDHQNPTDHDQIGRKFTILVGPSGKDSVRDYMHILRDSLMKAQVVLKLKPGTTVDTTGMDEDQGYQIEGSIDLTALGYPDGLGDGILFLGLTYYDGDSFIPTSSSYGTRTWWFRERESFAAAAYVYMDPNSKITSVAKTSSPVPEQFVLQGNYPNPFNPSTTIKYAVPQTGAVKLLVYDMLGRIVRTAALGEQEAGEHTFTFNASQLSSGVYYYSMRLQSASGGEFSTRVNKMLFIK